MSVYGRYKNDILLYLKPRQKLLNLLTYPKSIHPADIKFIHQTGADRCYVSRSTSVFCYIVDAYKFGLVNDALSHVSHVSNFCTVQYSNLCAVQLATMPGFSWIGTNL